ncbi:MAG: topoisomerase DNA-binding C4 zinc finger domain-containing protein [Methanobrevibacter sp.]|nr:topoisomerase DNA-binding C4 zinc finger domain-containing protein [Methanobrevibacter sp.]
MQCPVCGGELVKRSGRYGVFYGCSNFPECKYTQQIGSDTSYGYGDETYDYEESQTLRGWNPSMKKYGRKKQINHRYDDY